MIKNGEAYYYAHDFNKNVTELLDDQGAIRAAYDYTSFGAVTIHDPDTLGNPVQWSSEMHDEELRLVFTSRSSSCRKKSPWGDLLWLGRGRMREFCKKMRRFPTKRVRKRSLFFFQYSNCQIFAAFSESTSWSLFACPP